MPHFSANHTFRLSLAIAPVKDRFLFLHMLVRIMVLLLLLLPSQGARGASGLVVLPAGAIFPQVLHLCSECVCHVSQDVGAFCLTLLSRCDGV